MPPQRNIVLIGMPGAGKSTTGVILAKKLSMDFIDTDLVIQLNENRSLQSILDTSGYLELRRLEEKAILQLSLHNHVIATGGSAVYSQRAMEHLGRNGVTVFLDVAFEEVTRRITDFKTRGIACAPGQPFLDLYRERAELYRRYAAVTINVDRRTQEQAAEELIGRLFPPGDPDH